MRYQKPYVYAITVEYDLLTETKQWHIGLSFEFYILNSMHCNSISVF